MVDTAPRAVVLNNVGLHHPLGRGRISDTLHVRIPTIRNGSEITVTEVVAG